jgi:predicted alpha/beta-hydrolase family hydrolase
MKVLLGPGASKGAEGLRPHVDGLRARGFDAAALDLPRGSADRALLVFLKELRADPALVVGGHSFGGRVASLAAAEVTPTGLLLLSYPLHPPGKPEQWRERTAHWPRIACPVLLISGDRDQFARIDLLQGAVNQLPRHQVHVLPGAGHGFRRELDQALDLAARWLSTLTQ